MHPTKKDLLQFHINQLRQKAGYIPSKMLRPDWWSQYIQGTHRERYYINQFQIQKLDVTKR